MEALINISYHLNDLTVTTLVHEYLYINGAFGCFKQIRWTGYSLSLMESILSPLPLIVDQPVQACRYVIIIRKGLEPKHLTLISVSIRILFYWGLQKDLQWTSRCPEFCRIEWAMGEKDPGHNIRTLKLILILLGAHCSKLLGGWFSSFIEDILTSKAGAENTTCRCV